MWYISLLKEASLDHCLMLTLMASIKGERLFMISLDWLMVAVAQEWWEISQKSDQHDAVT